ncbi:MAG: PKD domain-containing protein [Planctomycetota bacterium]
MTILLALAIGGCGAEAGLGLAETAGLEKSIEAAAADEVMGPGESSEADAGEPQQVGAPTEAGGVDDAGGMIDDQTGQLEPLASGAADEKLGVRAADRDAGVMTTASRTTGVAPLLVFFDAVDTANWQSSVAQPPDGDFAAWRYAWDFGDDPGATWSTTGLPKNEANGFVAAHVYENPGTYTATLTLTDRNGAVTTYTQTIDVSGFAGTTYYVSSSTGSDTNDGLSQQRPFQTFGKAISVLGTNKRVLFKRGDSWTVTSGALITFPGPGVIGAYGTGSRPFFEVTTNTSLIKFQGTNTGDWRITDLHARGPATTTAGYMVLCDYSFQRVLMQGLKAEGFRSSYLNTYGDNRNFENGLVDCEGSGAPIVIAYLGAYRLAILGSYLHDCPQTHVLRVWHGTKSVVSHNSLLRPGATRHALKFHNDMSSPYPETRYAVIGDNLFQGDTWTVTISPQDNDSPEVISDVLFERNTIRATPNTQVALYIIAARVMARNNIIDGLGAARYFTGVEVTKGSLHPTPDRVSLINNTVVRWEESIPPGAEFTGVHIGTGPTNTLVRNNLFYAPPSHARWSVTNSGSGTVVDHNLANVDPSFVDPAGRDFRLRNGSAAIDAALGNFYVWEDYDCRTRPVSGTTDCGAFEAGAAPPTRGDLNCDGTVNFGDINPFVLAVSNPAGYAASYPNCNIMQGDLNGDGQVNFADISPFVALLVGS